MFHTFWNLYRIGVVLGMLACVSVFWMLPAPHDRDSGWALILLGIGGAITFFGQIRNHFSLNGRLQAFLGNIRKYSVFEEVIPSYRYVDYHRALERLAAVSSRALKLEYDSGQFPGNMTSLLEGFSWYRPVASPQVRVCIGYEEETFLATEVFWLILGPPDHDPGERMIIRLHSKRNPGVCLEIACKKQEQAAAMFQWLAKEAHAHSIFRGQFIELLYKQSAHDLEEFMHTSNELGVLFKQKPHVTERDIIIEKRLDEVLRRNVFDFFAHRDALHGYGIPRKRALLFYGPPGTGKTHTCRFVHTKLPGITTILVTGESLPYLQDISKFARQLHPCLVLIEDIDLVFSRREINPYGNILGELMDELDGFAPDEEVIFILTTNAIDRVEHAIKDRPGRINQCLHFGMPNAELRRRYLLRYLEAYNIEAVEIDRLVRQTERATQAFLKEYVLRAVQIAAEAAGYQNHRPLPLMTAHFEQAFDELMSHGDPHGHSIMGFHVDKDAASRER